MRVSKLLAAMSLVAAPLVGTASAQGADDCSNAQAISGLGTFAANNSSATSGGPSACGNMGRDIWWSWVAPNSTDYEVTTCGGASWDTVLAVYDGNCNSANQLSCNDDTCGLQSSVSWTATAGTAYLIRLGSWNGGSGGSGTIEISEGGGGSGGCNNPAVGPDVIVGAIPGITNYGATGGMAGYALGTTSCNVGDAELLWIANSNQHPVIGQNIYRVENGRLEQVGQSWLKHGFTALQQGLCCNCNSSGTGTRLGVGCSDPYSSSLNGSQSGLGPRFQVNAFTGGFSYPFAQQGQTGDRVFKRIQVSNDDVDPSLHPSATYFGESQYISPDDAAAGNGFNNVSYVPLSRPGTTTQGAWRLSIGGTTVREQPAMYAWAASEPSVAIEEINVPGEGQFVAGSNVVDNGDGTWTYNYAIFNNNSDYSGESFTVPLGSNVTVTDVGMSFPLYHSGEPYTNVDWTASVTSSDVTWSTESYMMNQDANALRWGTTYSFWFTADAAPEAKSGVLGLFKPGNPGPQIFPTEGPGTGGTTVVIQNYCTAVPNSTGVASSIIASNVDLTLRTMDLEGVNITPNAFGYFLASLNSGFVPNAGGSQGNLCLSGSIGRGVGGGILFSGTGGTFSTVVDLDQIPTPTGSTSVMSGDRWHFQGWHRDSVLGFATSNFTDGVWVQYP
ncbi:MAG: hypothetical protein PVJ89_00875 [Planctomycetota bacterium]